jgi:hypothetical protein
MPSESEQTNLQQPWKEWFNMLKPKEVIGDAGLVLAKEGNSGTTGSSTKHGTVALHPRHDVDFSKAKTTPK